MSTVSTQSPVQSPIHERIVREHRQFLDRLNGQQGKHLATLRLQAMEEFQRLGIPTVRHEEWKYTNLFPLLAKNFSLATEVDAAQMTDTVSAQFRHWGEPALVVNGMLHPPAASVVGSLRHALEMDQSFLTELGKLAPFKGDAIIAWNTAFLRDGAVIRVGDGVEYGTPIVLVSLLDGRDGNVVVHERHLLQLGRRSSLTLVLVQRSLGDGQVLLEQVLEGWVGEDSTLRLILVQDAPATNHAITTHCIELERNARLHMTTISIGGGFIRNMPVVRLAGEGADAQLYGLTIADGTMLVDHHTTVDHAVPNCTSNELYKAILDGRSTGVFNGKIVVRPHAQKTSAYQANRNIVLSNRATINTKPQLEIFANDVRCTHGCTVGRLDREALFYLRTRGLSTKEAEALLLTAFAEEITGTVPLNVLRTEINAQIEHLLGADELA